MAKSVYLKVEKIINCPLEQVWNTVAIGFGNVSDYNPAIKSSQLDSKVKSGVGMKRHCDFETKGYIKEEIIEWADNDYFMLRFIESSVPMAVLESKFSFKTENGKTKIIQEFWYRMKAPIGWLSGLMKNKMHKTLIEGLNGLENYLKN